MRLINILALIAIIWAVTAPVIHSIAPEKPGTCAYAAMSQEPASAPAQTEQPAGDSAVLYRVMAVVLMVWIGLAIFLFRLDRRVAALEKEMQRRE